MSKFIKVTEISVSNSTFYDLGNVLGLSRPGQ